MLTRRQLITTAGSLAMAATAVGLGSPPARAISINPRSSWATDRPPKGPLDPEDVRFLIAHHSASRNGHTSADAPSILRSFYDFHTGDKGWNDIAYNFLIDSGGGIWEGRAGSLDGPVAGDATGGNQGFTQLVCVIGDYNAAQPTRASLTALVSLLAWLSDRYSIVTDPGSAVTFVSRGSNKWPAGSSVTTPTIIGHRAMSQTTCPGTNLNNYVVGSLMADVTAARGGQPVSPTTQPATTTAAVPAPTADSSSTTTSVPSTTALFETTTTVAAPTSTAGPTTSIGSVATTTPVAVGTPSTISAPTPDAASTVSPLIAGAAGVAALATGLVAWRFRRLSGKHLP